MYQERGYNIPFMRRAADGLAEGLLFTLQHWRILAAIAGAAIWFLNRETEEELAQKPALVDAIIANATARCEKQNLLTEKSPYESRLRDALNDAHFKSLDTLAYHRVTICLDQRHNPLSKGLISKDFYAGYYNNNGDPVVTLRDDGYANKEAGFLSRKIDKYSGEALNKLARHFPRAKALPGGMSFAVEYKESCGEDCTRRFVDWTRPEKLTSYMTKIAGITIPPLKADAPAVKYPEYNW